MNNWIFKPLAIATLAASFLMGQTTPSTGTAPTTAQIVANLVARLTTLLTLTTAQQTDASTIFTTAQTALATIRANVQTDQTALQTAITSNDPTAIQTQATAIGNLTTQQIESQATAAAAFYAILTPAQQTQLTQLNKFGLGLPSGPGFGPGLGGPGFGGPGPGGHH